MDQAHGGVVDVGKLTRSGSTSCLRGVTYSIDFDGIQHITMEVSHASTTSDPPPLHSLR